MTPTPLEHRILVALTAFQDFVGVNDIRAEMPSAPSGGTCGNQLSVMLRRGWVLSIPGATRKHSRRWKISDKGRALL